MSATVTMGTDYIVAQAAPSPPYCTGTALPAVAQIAATVTVAPGIPD